MDSRNRCLAGLIALFMGTTAFCAGTGSVVTVHGAPRQQMTYGMDFERLWYWDALAPAEKLKLAKLAVADCKVDYVRVALVVGAEAEEGKIDWDKAYGPVTNCMLALRNARPDIKFFAIPRPIHGEVKGAPYTCFPLWVTIFNDKGKITAFHWQKAADLLVRHLRFLKGKGFKITYVDAKNECDKKLEPVDIAKMLASMRQQLGADMPLVIAPSSFDYKSGANWLKEAAEKVGTNFFDIAATHNSKEKGTLDEFVAQAASMGKTTWNTELHNWNGPDELAVTNTGILFGQIRAGVSGINEWLSLGNEIKTHKMFRAVSNNVEVMRRYYIYKKLVNTSGGGRYLAMDVPGGLTSAVAFIKGKTLTVWLLNGGASATAPITVTLEGHALAGDTIGKTWWGPENGREGSTDRIKASSKTAFTAVVPGNSLYCFEGEVAESLRAPGSSETERNE